MAPGQNEPVGLERRVATEFSFFLAIPIIFGATAYELYKDWHLLSTDALGSFALGFIAAFVSAFICVAPGSLKSTVRPLRSRCFGSLATPRRVATPIAVALPCHAV